MAPAPIRPSPIPSLGPERWTCAAAAKRPTSAARQRLVCERLAAPWNLKRRNDCMNSEKTATTSVVVPRPPDSPGVEPRRIRESVAPQHTEAPVAATATLTVYPHREVENRNDVRPSSLIPGNATVAGSKRPVSARIEMGGINDQGRRATSMCVASRLAGQPTPAGGVVQPRYQRPYQAHVPVPISRPEEARTTIQQMPRRTVREQRAVCARLSTPRTRPETPKQQERQLSLRDTQQPSPDIQQTPCEAPPLSVPNHGDANHVVKAVGLMRRLNESASWLSVDCASASENGSDVEKEKHEAQPVPPSIKAPFCLYEMLNESATWIPCDLSDSGEDEPVAGPQPPSGGPQQLTVDGLSQRAPPRSYSF